MIYISMALEIALFFAIKWLDMSRDSGFLNPTIQPFDGNEQAGHPLHRWLVTVLGVDAGRLIRGDLAWGPLKSVAPRSNWC